MGRKLKQLGWTDSTMTDVAKEIGLIHSVPSHLVNQAGIKTTNEITTLAGLSEARIIFKDIVENGVGHGINEDIANYFKRHGFYVSQKDIGWEIRQGPTNCQISMI